MKTNIILLALFLIFLTSCGSLDRLARHGFETGFYEVKEKGLPAEKIYAEKLEDSVTIFLVNGNGRDKAVDTGFYYAANVNRLKAGDYLYNKTFIKTSVDFDLTTALLKYRLPQKNVPRQLSANLNAAIYVGFRKDYYILKTRTSPLKKESTSLHHFGFDFGPFLGVGITPMNYSVTENNVEIEYDGIVFQKGIAIFFGIDFLTFGISLGWDNLLDENHKYWIYNNKPWIGLMLGVANF